jgi:hypothetical protein
MIVFDPFAMVLIVITNKMWKRHGGGVTNNQPDLDLNQEPTILVQPMSGVKVSLPLTENKPPIKKEVDDEVYVEEKHDPTLVEEVNPEDEVVVIPSKYEQKFGPKYKEVYDEVIEEVNKEEEKPKVDPKTGNIDLKYGPKLVDEDFYLTQREKPKVDPKKVIKTEPKMVKEDFSETKGEELDRTWRNILKERKRRKNNTNNGISRI